MDKCIIVKLNDKVLENLFKNLISEEKVYIAYFGKWFVYKALITSYCHYIKNNKRSFVLMNKNADMDFGSCEGEYLCRINDDSMLIDIDNDLILYLEIDEQTFKQYCDNNDDMCAQDDEQYKGEPLKKPFITSIDYRDFYYSQAKIKVGLSKINSYSYIKFIREFLSTKRNGFIEIKSDYRTIYLKNLGAESTYTLDKQTFYSGEGINILDVFRNQDTFYDFITYFSNDDGQENISIKINDSLYVHYQNSNKGTYEYILEYEKIQRQIREENNEIERNYWSGLSKEEIESWDNMLED